MSFDLIFFDARVAPKSETDFDNWLEGLEDFSEFFDDETHCSDNLQKCFIEFSDVFPSMDQSNNNIDEAHITQYSFAKHMIEGNFAFSVAEEAGTLILKIAAKYEIGIFDAQESEVYLPISQTEFKKFRIYNY
ncbi:hypothetical protein N9W89_09540 [Hellea sp.]|nr:hypothetical protein [Hellea sp.]